jgi:hypothetical protein
MAQRTGWPNGALAVLVLQLLPIAGSTAAQDSTVFRVRVGPGFDAHSDLLTSPFRQHGTGIDAALGVATRHLAVTLGGGALRSGSSIETSDGGFDDVWTAALDIRGGLHRWGPSPRTEVDLGVSLGGLADVRRHQYSPGYTEIFADLAFPLSASASLGYHLGGRGRLEERMDVGLVTLLLRSPFAGTKALPPAAWAGPWDVQLVRHRLRLSTRASRHLGLFITHGLTILATDRERPLRVVRQDVSVGLELIRGGGDGV